MSTLDAPKASSQFWGPEKSAQELEAVPTVRVLKAEHGAYGLEGIQILAIVLQKPRTIGFEQFIRVMQIFAKVQQGILQYGQHEIALRKRMFVASNCTPKNSALHVVAFWVLNR